MIEYYRIGGQLFAKVRRIAAGYVWYVTWGFYERPRHDYSGVPDDIQ